MIRAAAALAAAFALGSCSRSSSELQTGADLLAVAVKSSEARPHAEFNGAMAKAAAAGETWTRDPAIVARRFGEFGTERSGVLVLKGSGEHSSRYDIIAVADGFTDDSVRGRRLDIKLESNGDESWRVTEARVSWRCWPERGHQTFGTEACH